MVVDEYTKETWKKTWKNLLVGIIILITIKVIRPENYWETLIIITTIIWAASITSSIINKEKILLKNWCLTPIMVGGFILAFIILEKIFGNGWLGFIITITMLVAYKLFKRRREYMEGIRKIETMIWGKSLDRNNWGEKKK